MKKIVYIFIVLLFANCDSENAPDCFKNAGHIIEKSYNVDSFTEITVFKNIELIVTDALNQSIIVETGENLIENVSVTVENGKLLLKDNNACNFTRDYNITKVYVSVPNLTKIRNSSQFTVRSNGVLNYPDINLISEDDSGDFYNTGIFNVEVNATNVVVVINNTTTTYISGSVTNLRINHASGDGRFEGRNLFADNVFVYHRGTNDIIVNPQLKLNANLVSTGNVISVTTPPILEIQEQFDGRVIFE